MMIPYSVAYFRTLFIKQGMNSVMVELIFDRLDFTNASVTDAGFSDVDENGNEIPWGSEKNPYVISQKYHVQNLSVLQNAGFFAERTETDANGNEVPIQPHFRVCKTDGTPVAIDCEDMTIEPVGSYELPFTGVIRGSIFDGTTTYASYGTSVSTIANLTVEASVDEPDIGFFGHVGYYGAYDEDTETLTGGYAATIEDLLFADITVQSKKSLLDTIENWWNSLFPNHTNNNATHGESHHVGIVAGHAEFATITDVSVYYSEGVEAFRLESNASGSNTNYFSTTGLIGLLRYVNPAVGEDGTLDGSQGVSDSDLIGDGSDGGGGDESGSLTGYFLAETLFESHEEYLTLESLSKKTKYDVKEMKKPELDENGNYKALFSSIVMKEGFQLFGGTNVTYYYFNDTVFTFAMSSSSADSASDATKTDYVMRLWNLEENTPKIYGTSSADKWEYTDDLNSTPRISYKLTAVEGTAGLTTGGYYVMAYLYDGKIYLFDMTRSGTFMFELPADQIYTADGVATSYYDDGSLKEINLIGTNKKYLENSFYYASTSIKMRSPDDTLSNYKFGFTVPYANNAYSAPLPYYGDKDQSTTTMLSINTAYLYNNTFEYFQNGKFSIYSQNQRIGNSGFIGIGSNYTYVSAMFQFDTTAKGLSVEYDMNKTSTDDLATIASMKDETNYFTILKLNANTVDGHGDITTLADGNYELTPKNIIPVTKTETDTETGEVTDVLDENGNPVLDTLYDFDPSKYVLEYVNETNSYRLAPIRSYKLNNGQGDLLQTLNHTVKLYKATEGNFSLSFGSNLQIYSDGGVLKVPIGSNGSEATIPAGMIAFDIIEASAENPSYINMIVAVNPEQTTASTVGLWQTDESFWGSEFDLSSPDQEFKLPISKTAASSADSQYILHVTERV
ncbi:MAG: hypothetical protein IJC50_03875, partial [Clostridia bacterium]|nr:hypothetical protein [Clostridia bacterium]